MNKSLVLSLFLVSAFLSSCNKGAQEAKIETMPDSIKNLQNASASLTVSIQGGSYIDFHRTENPINPLSWKLTKADMPENNKKGPPFQGHFLCLGRWGSPSEGEMKKGVPHNGEPSTNWWKVDESTARLIAMSSDAPLDGLHIKRTVELDPNESVFRVDEEVTNTFSLSRPYNIVQHATLGPPFLDSTTIVNTNAGKGFLQDYSFPDPHKYSFTWPNGYSDSVKTPLNLESSLGNTNYVSTHIFNSSSDIGWITATTPHTSLTIGYLWKVSEYPWVNVWHFVKDKKPVAKGLEFGTTGVGGKPYSELIMNDTRFYGQYSFEYIDSGEAKQKSFVCFLTTMPEGFKRVKDIKVTDNTIQLIIEGNKNQNIVIKTEISLFK